MNTAIRIFCVCPMSQRTISTSLKDNVCLSVVVVLVVIVVVVVVSVAVVVVVRNKTSQIGTEMAVKKKTPPQ